MLADAAQRELLCDGCGGQRIYDPAAAGLACTQCGQAAAIHAPEDHDAAAERDYEPQREDPVALAVETHSCETCGGEVIFTGPVLSTRCAYCDGPVVLRQGEDGFETMALIPFRVPEADAQALAQNWVAKRRAAPGDLGEVVASARVAGLYAPFWTFDSEEAVEYWATYRRGTGDNAVTEKVSGRLSMSFDDLLVPASPHITPLIRDGVIHEFAPDNLRPYGPEYLAGFAAERHHQTVEAGLKAAEDDKDLLIRNRIKRHVGKRNVKVSRYKTDTTGIRYRRILMPVWILHYEYNGKPMKVVVCGLHGRTFGERPFSSAKLFAYSAAITAGVMLFGLLWGALGGL